MAVDGGSRSMRGHLLRCMATVVEACDLLAAAGFPLQAAAWRDRVRAAADYLNTLGGRSPGARVRCQCGGGGWLFVQLPDDPTAGEAWPCYRWVCAGTGLKVSHCPACGVPVSLLSVAPADRASNEIDST